MKDHLQDGVKKLHAIFGTKLTLIVCDGKRPRRKGWNTLTVADMTQEYLNSLAGPNLGVVCGRNSNDLCALDIDSDEHLDAFLAAVPTARRWSTVRGRRGAKLFVRVEGDYPYTYKLVAGGMDWGEWCSHGANSVVWGNHPDTGTPYTWTNATTPPTIRFEAIKQALTRLGVGRKSNARSKSALTPQQNTPPTTSSSATCTLHPVPCTLYDTSSADDVVARIKAREAMRQATVDAFDKLAELYHQYIERQFAAAAGHRNGFLVESIPFLLRCVSPEVAVSLVMLFYDTHRYLFDDPRERHEYEARAMIETVEQSYRAELSDCERAVFEVLPPTAQAAFRICRDLASRPTPPRPPMTFYLSSDNLAARLQMHGRQAHRLLEAFAGDGVVQLLKKGERWQKGVQAKASTYQWTLPTSKPS